MSSATTCRADFEQLALPLFASLYNHAFWLTRNQAEAEDLVQETFSKSLRAFDSFQPGTNFKAWIFRILPQHLPHLSHRHRHLPHRLP